MASQCNTITTYSIEMLTTVFSYLEADDLCWANEVNKKWQIVTSRDCLWKGLFFRIENPVSSSMSMKQYICLHGVKSFNHLATRIQQFANTVTLNQAGKFTCHFAFNPESSIYALFHHGIYDPTDPPQKTHFIFAKKCDGEGTFNGYELNVSLQNNRTTSIHYQILLPMNSETVLFPRRITEIFHTRIDALKTQDPSPHLAPIEQ